MKARKSTTIRTGEEALISQSYSWTPVWLRRSALLALSTVLALLLLSSLALWYSVKVHNGLALNISTNQYLWIYGPTAVLTVIVSLWRQVDYYCKLIEPWRQMRDGAVPVSHSLLLNYLSPIQITSFIRAIKNRHHPIAISILGFATLKLVVVISTGLIISVPTDASHNILVQALNQFDDTSFVQTYLDQPAVLLGDYANLAIMNVSTAIVYAYEGVLNGLPRPNNTYDTIAYQSFDTDVSLSPLVHTSANMNQLARSISTEVDTFVPIITCEQANATYMGDILGDGYVALKTPTCSVGRVVQGNTTYETPLILPGSLEYWQFAYAPQCDGCEWRVWLDVTMVNCSETGNMTWAYLNSTSAYDIRWAFVAANVTNDTAVPSWSQVSVAVCKFDYTMAKGNLTYDLQTGTPTLTPAQTPENNVHLPNLIPLAFAQVVYGALYARLENLAADPFDDGNTRDVFGLNASPMIFGLMNKLVGNNASRDQFLDVQKMIEYAPRVIGGVAAMCAQHYLLSNASIQLQGVYDYIEPRLHLRLVSFIGVTVGIAVVLVLTLALSFSTDFSTVPQDPAPLASQAMILASSVRLKSILRGLGYARTSYLRKKLDGFKFTTTNDAFSVRVIDDHPKTTESQPSKAKKKRAWSPFAGRRDVAAITLIIPILAITALEILYRASERNNGFLNVKDDNNPAFYAIRYTTVVIAVTVATLFNSLDFAVTTIAPFSALRSGTTASRGLLCNLFGKIPLYALYEAIRHGYIAVACINLATLTGSLLTIVSAGLWVFDSQVTMQSPITVNRVDMWDLSWPNSMYNDSGAFKRYTLVQNGAMGLPSTIVDNYVIPDVTFSTQSELINIPHSNVNYTIDVPVLTSFLDCSVIPQSALTVASYNMTANVGLPSGCFGGALGNQDYSYFYTDFPTPSEDVMYSEWQIKFGDLHMGPWDPQLPPDAAFRPSDGNIQDDRPDNPAGCPSIAVMYGYGSDPAGSIQNATALVCYQRLKEVTTSITYAGSLSSTAIQRQSTLVPKENSQRYLTNGTNGVDSFPWRLQARLDDATIDIDDSGEMPSVFQQILDAADPDSLEAMLGVHNSDTLIRGVSGVVQRYMAHVIDLQFRTAKPTTTTSAQNLQGNDAPIPGTATWHIRRVKVNYTSKLTLQIALAVMTVLGGLSYALIDLRSTLPRDPCSIAGAMAFFAESSMLSGHGFSLEQNSLKEMRESLDGKAFSLGWWDKAREDVVSRAGSGAGAGSGSMQKEDNQALLLAETKWFGIDAGIAGSSTYSSISGSGRSLSRRLWRGFRAKS